MKSRKTQKVKT